MHLWVKTESFGYMPRSMMLGHRALLVLVHREASTLAAPISVPTNVEEGFLFPTSSSAFIVICFLHGNHSNRVVFIFISLMAKDVCSANSNGT